MYGCFSPYLVYGWCEGKTTDVISYHWLEVNKIDLFASNVIRMHGYEAVYGLIVNVDINGQIIIDEIDRQFVLNAYQAYLIKKNIPINSDSQNKPKLGFYLCVRGDVEWNEHEKYFEKE